MSEKITYTPEQVFGEYTIKEWKENGHWPPPIGVKVLPESRIDEKQVIKHFITLMNISTPKERKIIREILIENYDIEKQDLYPSGK